MRGAEPKRRPRQPQQAHLIALKIKRARQRRHGQRAIIVSCPRAVLANRQRKQAVPCRAAARARDCKWKAKCMPSWNSAPMRKYGVKMLPYRENRARAAKHQCRREAGTMRGHGNHEKSRAADGRGDDGAVIVACGGRRPGGRRRRTHGKTPACRRGGVAK